MRKLSLLKFVILFFASTSFAAPPAEELDDSHAGPIPAAKNVVFGKTFLTKNQGKVYVMVRNDGHLIGQPFSVEVRADCGASMRSWKELEVADMKSACRVKSETLKLDQAKGTLTIQVSDIDWDLYNAEARKNEGYAEHKCSKKTEPFVVKLESLCKK